MKTQSTLTPGKADDIIAKAGRLLVIEQLVCEAGEQTPARLRERGMLIAEADDLLDAVRSQIDAQQEQLASFFTSEQRAQATAALNTMCAINARR